MTQVGTILRIDSNGEETRYFCDEDSKILSLNVAQMVVEKLRKKSKRLTEQHNEALQTTIQQLGIYSYDMDHIELSEESEDDADDMTSVGTHDSSVWTNSNGLNMWTNPENGTHYELSVCPITQGT